MTNDKMKYIFFGTPRFAEIILKKLIENGMPPVALVCNPDKPFGRKKEITPPPTKSVVSEWQLVNNGEIQILQPDKIDEIFLSELRGFDADFFVVAAYAKILPKGLLDIPELGVIGVHPSILPKYRGSSPIQSAILSGEDITGVSLYIIDEKVDHGPTLKIKSLNIKNQNYLKLEEELAELGGKLLVKVLPDFVAGNINPVAQNHSMATFTKKFDSRDGFVEYEDLQKAQSGEDKNKAIEIDRKIRALNPEPGVYTFINNNPFDYAQGKRVKLLEAILADEKLKLIKIQKAGKKPETLH